MSDRCNHLSIAVDQSGRTFCKSCELLFGYKAWCYICGFEHFHAGKPSRQPPEYKPPPSPAVIRQWMTANPIDHLDDDGRARYLDGLQIILWWHKHWNLPAAIIASDEDCLARAARHPLLSPPHPQGTQSP